MGSMVRSESTRGRLLLVPVLSLAVSSCQLQSGKYPWNSAAGDVQSQHAEVRTLNTDYLRTTSHVLVREVDRPTRANLDYAAYHQNFMIAAEAQEPGPEGTQPDVSNPFGGLVAKDTLTADFSSVPLTEAERTAPLAFTALVELLASKSLPGSDKLLELAAKVRDESWGLPKTPGIAISSLSEVYLHTVAGSAVPELWAKIEFEPWFHGLGDLPDPDEDGYPEVYGRVLPGYLSAEATTFIQNEYRGQVLDAAEVRGWANKLASYWYPSFNTDLVPPGEQFPDSTTEAVIRDELHGKSFPKPTIVMRGKPQGQATYNVFLVKGLGGGDAKGSSTGGWKPTPTKPSPRPQPLVTAIEQELKDNGGSWAAWQKQVAPFQATVKKRLQALPKDVNALAGEDGFLFFRNSLKFVIAGDLAKQKKGKNPVPAILEFKRTLEAQGVDFLFVPVPPKEELFPEALVPEQRALVGKVVHPLYRKFLLELGKSGVEVVDLLPKFLAARQADASASEPLYQRQDTHWTDRGLQLAAQLLSERIKQYPWYKQIAPHAQRFTTRSAPFERFGDLHSRLPDALQTKYQPEKLAAFQVLDPTGKPYEDDAESPIVMLGDSYTGVYQLMDAEHAGVSAHVARSISYPLDLVMSYGGGPNVRTKLMRRGVEDLGKKKLVIWLMTARDLYDYWEDWEPLKSGKEPRE